jgi:hypothetical protein
VSPNDPMRQVINEALVLLRCGGKGGRCGALQGALTGDRETRLITFPMNRPCRCFVSMATIALQTAELDTLANKAVADLERCAREGRAFKPPIFIVWPQSGRRHIDGLDILAARDADDSPIVVHEVRFADRNDALTLEWQQNRHPG